MLGPATFTLTSGTLTRVFAVGQPSRGTMDAIVQVLSISARGASAPNSIDTGSGGAAAASADYWTPARIALFVAGTLLLGVAGTSLWRRRRMRASTP